VKKQMALHGITLQSIAIFFGTVAMFLFSLPACNREKKEMVDIVFDREHTFTMKATEVSTLISDSGITRYKIVTLEWLFFEEASEPYWYFPEKIHVEKFDTLFRVETRIDADTARFFTKKKLWKLTGNVEVENLKGERFETSLLYWDQNGEKIYSDSFIRITKGEFINTGTGFESNQTLTRYQIRHPSGEIPFRDNIPPDSTAIPDSTAVMPADTATTVCYNYQTEFHYADANRTAKSLLYSIIPRRRQIHSMVMPYVYDTVYDVRTRIKKMKSLPDSRIKKENGGRQTDNERPGFLTDNVCRFASLAHVPLRACNRVYSSANGYCETYPRSANIFPNGFP
jgi:LPS export ABC transporter protein LptC